MNRLFFASLFLLLLIGIVSRETVPAFGQETGGQTGAVPPSTVIKNRSPIELTPLDLKIPAAKEFPLANGIRIFVIEDHRTPLFSVSVSIPAGQLFEPDDKQGVAEMAAVMLEEGTTTRSMDAIAEITDKYGANLSAIATNEKTMVSVSGLVEDSDPLIALLADVVQNPAFPEERFSRVRFRAAARASARASDPNFRGADAMRSAMYGPDTAYGRPAPTPTEINGLIIADLKAFQHTFYRPEGTIIGVAGDVDTRKIVDALKKQFGEWKAPSDAGPPPTLPKAVVKALPPGTPPAPIIVDRPGSAQTVLLFGVPAIDRSNPDYIPLYVANRVLGGGFNSRLNQKLREEKGYTYGARSTLNAPKWEGTWEASASVRTAVTVPAAQEFINEFSRLQTVPPKPGELDLVKQSIIGSFALTLESSEAILQRSNERYEYGLPNDYWDTYAARIRGVTPDDVTRMARKYWGNGASEAAKPLFWSVAVGEKSAFDSGLNDLTK